MIRPLLQRLLRAKTPILFTDPQRTEPVSRQFGLERGTSIDRYYIDQFLQQNKALIRGHVLEVAASDYSKRYGSQVEAYEVLHATADNANATIIGDLTDPATLPANRIDCFICTQTFNFIFDVQKAVHGAYHLLKPGGVLLATVAGISQISRYDMDRWGDFWRFTTASVDKLFAPIFTGGVEIRSVGNVLAATAFLQGLCVEDLPDATLLQHQDPDYQLLLTVVARKAG